MGSMNQQKPGYGPDYGIDAPGVVRNFLLIGVAGLTLVAVSRFFLLPGYPALVRALEGPGLWGGGYCLFAAAVMVWGSKVGKLRVRDRLLDSIPWSGREMVLDVGCGRGLLLIGAAKRLTSGKAIGIDIWQTEDQTGSHPENTRRNAASEGVLDRVQTQDGDARNMPFPDGSFDVVLSSWALHNIYNDAERAKALREIVRVLKPGGRVAIVDVWHAREYARFFEENGFTEVKLKGPNFLFVIPSFRVAAKKR